ncbi:MAG TPA: FAD-dependent oxidoreductase [Hyphomicrobiaceae bacterium]|nr:FAD-dependent oxidoreductase [Hyphomicrobiaceae bacterium]
MRAYDLAVIGGGVHGASAALFAARAGLKVVLIERGALCREASGVNAGTLTIQVTRLALLPHAIGGHQMWATARDWLGHDVGVVVTDGLQLAFSKAEAALLEERTARRREAGAPLRLVTAKEARAIEPGLSESVLLASHSATDGFAAPYLAGRAFRRALIETGVAVFEGVYAEGIDRQGAAYAIRLSELSGERVIAATRLVLAGGAWIEEMLGWLGLAVPIAVKINQVAVTERLRPVMRSQIGIASGLLSLRQYPNGTVVIGGGWQGRGDRQKGAHEIEPANLIGNVRLACHAIPALRSGRIVRSWAGIEGKTADELPIIGRLPGHENAWAVGGLHSGFTCGPYVGRELARLITGAESNMPLFPPDRLVARAVR